MADVKKTEKCPLCGSDNYTPDPLPETLKEEFVMSMLAETPFSRTYALMDNKIMIRVSGMTDKELRMKARVMIKIEKLVLKFPDAASYKPFLIQYVDAALQVKEVTIKPAASSACSTEVKGKDRVKAVLALDWDSVTDTTVEDFLDTLFDTLSEDLIPGQSVPSALLRAAVQKHNILVARLVEECIDVNFIGGIGL